MALHHPLLIPMLAHVLWATILYTVLTVVRAPSIWGIGKAPDGTNPWAAIEPRISANLSNQFEWPVLFYAACILLIQQSLEGKSVLLLAWIFILGRVVHSFVQIFTRNIRLRGVVFTINFLAVLGLWVVIASNL
ncbi:MAPEG family protein [Solilutibacter silvestris]|uniref:MAPEG family protein n=1 Tax=Solilutibacter silvestris TaxID=1645665 RepID=UPI003D337F06